MRYKKLDRIFMTIDRRPVQARPAEHPFCIDVGPALEQPRCDRRVAIPAGALENV